MKQLFTLLLGGWLALTARAQTPTDALFMDRFQLCNAVLYQHSSWDHYWEGTLLRNNANIGTNIQQSVRYMTAYGLTKRLNVLASVPYVWTRNTDGHWAGQRGVQDISVWAKYAFLQKKFTHSDFTLFTTLGASVPSHDYVKDLLPMSIGFGAKTASARLIADYRLANGLYLTAQGGHTWRGRATIDRDAYWYNNEVVHSNEVVVPNVLDATMQLGWRRGLWNVALQADRMTGTSGNDIRRNDAPFLTNNMQATAIGGMVKFHAKHLGAVVNVQQTYAGRNVGRALAVQAGLLYAFYVKKPAQPAAELLHNR